MAKDKFSHQEGTPKHPEYHQDPDSSHSLWHAFKPGNLLLLRSRIWVASTKLRDKRQNQDRPNGKKKSWPDFIFFQVGGLAGELDAPVLAVVSVVVPRLTHQGTYHFYDIHDCYQLLARIQAELSA